MAYPHGALAPPSGAGHSRGRSFVTAVVGAVASAVFGAAVMSLFSTGLAVGGSAATSAAAGGGDDGLLHPVWRQAPEAANVTSDRATAALLKDANEAHVKALPPLPLPELFQRQQGFFTLYTGKGTLHGRVLLEVPSSALDVPFVLTTIVTSSDAQRSSPGRPFHLSWNDDRRVMAFRKSASANSALDLYRPLMDLRAEGEDGHSTSFPAVGYWAGWLRTFTVRDLSANVFLIDITEWVKDDGLQEITDATFEDGNQWETVDRRFEGGSANDRSVDLDVEVRLRPKKVLTPLPLSPEHWVSTRVRFSLLALPAKPMTPRHADHRIGFFASSFVATDDVSGLRSKRSYIQRWDLSRGPVRFIVDPTVPARWRSTVKAGVEEWNKAFKAAGHPSAIKAILPGQPDWPADYTVGDGRYNSIYWASGQARLSATGTVDVDPRSGEIVRAQVVLTDTAMAWFMTEFRRSVPANLTPGDAPWRPVANLTSAEVQGQFLKSLVIHEVGHVVGLRHNFRGSAGVALRDMADPVAVASASYTTSAMDYEKYVVRADPAKQLPVLSSITVGRYDVAAIVYGYGNFSTDAERLAFARATAAGGLSFCTDDDNPSWTGADPYCSRWDTSASPLTFANETLGVAVAAMASTAAAAARTDGASWLDASAAMVNHLGLATDQLRRAALFIGGVAVSRVDSDGVGGVKPVTPIDGATQAAALRMIEGALDPVGGLLGAATAATYGPLLVTRTCGRDDDGSARPEAPGDACLGVEAHNVVGTLRSHRGRVLAQLLHPARLERLTDARAAGATDVLSVGALLRRLTTALVVPAAAADGGGGDVAADAGVQWVEALTAVVTGRSDTRPPHHPAAVGAAAAELRRIHTSVAAATDDASVGLAVLLKYFGVSA